MVQCTKRRFAVEIDVAERCIEDVDANVTFFEQRVGAREQKQRRVPEADQVGHERLFIGKDEAADHDQQFGDDHEQREPVEAERARAEDRNDDAGEQHREMHIGAAEARPPEVDRHFVADQSGQEALDPQVGDDDVGQADQQHGPEGGAQDEGDDAVDGLAFLTQGTTGRAHHIANS